MPKAKPKSKSEECCDGKQNPFVAIGASVAGIYMIVVLFTLLFAEAQAGILVSIAWAFAVIALGMGFFASKQK